MDGCLSPGEKNTPYTLSLFLRTIGWNFIKQALTTGAGFDRAGLIDWSDGKGDRHRNQ